MPVPHFKSTESVSEGELEDICELPHTQYRWTWGPYGKTLVYSLDKIHQHVIVKTLLDLGANYLGFILSFLVC